jgi:hypothetical protein
MALVENEPICVLESVSNTVDVNTAASAESIAAIWAVPSTLACKVLNPAICAVKSTLTWLVPKAEISEPIPNET